MFEVGFTEIVLILGLALLVLGPEKLPGLAEKVGRWTGRARAMARQLRTQLEHEVTLEELARSKPMSTSSSPAPDAPAEPPSNQATADVDGVERTTPHTEYEVGSPAHTPSDQPHPPDESTTKAAQ